MNLTIVHVESNSFFRTEKNGFNQNFVSDPGQRRPEKIVKRPFDKFCCVWVVLRSSIDTFCEPDAFTSLYDVDKNKLRAKTLNFRRLMTHI